MNGIQTYSLGMQQPALWLIIVLIGSLSLVACTPAPEAAAPTAITPPLVATPAEMVDTDDAAGVVTLDAIVANPDAYLGQTVSLVGRATQMLGARSFFMSDLSVPNGSLLVVSIYEPIPVITGDTVSVQGVVRRLVEAEIENEFSFDLEDNLASQLAGLPMVIADRVDLVAGGTEN